MAAVIDAAGRVQGVLTFAEAQRLASSLRAAAGLSPRYPAPVRQCSCPSSLSVNAAASPGLHTASTSASGELLPVGAAPRLSGIPGQSAAHDSPLHHQAANIPLEEQKSHSQTPPAMTASPAGAFPIKGGGECVAPGCPASAPPTTVLAGSIPLDRNLSVISSETLARAVARMRLARCRTLLVVDNDHRPLRLLRDADLVGVFAQDPAWAEHFQDSLWNDWLTTRTRSDSNIGADRDPSQADSSSPPHSLPVGFSRERSVSWSLHHRDPSSLQRHPSGSNTVAPSASGTTRVSSPMRPTTPPTSTSSTVTQQNSLGPGGPTASASPLHTPGTSPLRWDPLALVASSESLCPSSAQ